MSLPLQPQRSSTRTSLRVRDGFREIGHDLKEGIHNAQETIKRRMSISMDTHSQQKKKPKRNRNRTLSMIAVGAVDKVLGRASPRHFGSEDDGSRDRSYLGDAEPYQATLHSAWQTSSDNAPTTHKAANYTENISYPGPHGVTPAPRPQLVDGLLQDLDQLDRSGNTLQGSHKDRFDRTVRDADEYSAVASGSTSSQQLSDYRNSQPVIVYDDEDIESQIDGGEIVADDKKEICPWPDCRGTTGPKGSVKFESNRLKEHIRRAHLRPYMCSTPGCHMRQGDKHQIYRHRKAKHPNEDSALLKDQDQDLLAMRQQKALNERSISYARISKICKATTTDELDEPWECTGGQHSGTAYRVVHSSIDASQARAASFSSSIGYHEASSSNSPISPSPVPAPQFTHNDILYDEVPHSHNLMNQSSHPQTSIHGSFDSSQPLFPPAIDSSHPQAPIHGSFDSSQPLFPPTNNSQPLFPPTIDITQPLFPPTIDNTQAKIIDFVNNVLVPSVYKLQVGSHREKYLRQTLQRLHQSTVRGVDKLDRRNASCTPPDPPQLLPSSNSTPATKLYHHHHHHHHHHHQPSYTEMISLQLSQEMPTPAMSHTKSLTERSASYGSLRGGGTFMAPPGFQGYQPDVSQKPELEMGPMIWQPESIPADHVMAGDYQQQWSSSASGMLPWMLDHYGPDVNPTTTDRLGHL